MYHKRLNLDISCHVELIKDIIKRKKKHIENNFDIHFFSTFNKTTKIKEYETFIFNDILNNSLIKIVIINFISLYSTNNIFNELFKVTNIDFKFDILNKFIIDYLKCKYKDELNNIKNIEEIILKIKLMDNNILHLSIYIKC